MSTSPGTTNDAPEERIPAPSARRSSRYKAALIAGMPLLVLLALAVVEFPTCPTRLGFGVPCPGCGLTRATLAGLRLDWHGVLKFHPLAPILTPLVAWSFVKPVLLELGWMKNEWLARLPRPPRAVWWALAIAIAVLWAGRLAGYFGGHPDPIDVSQGYFVRALWALTGGG